MKNYQLTPEDFLRGGLDIDYLFSSLNFYQLKHDEYTPYNSKLLSYTQLDKIAGTDVEVNSAINLWQANVGANYSTVHASTELARKRLANIIDSKLKWNFFEKKATRMLATEGNAVIYLNDVGDIVVQSLRYFNIHWDKLNDRAKTYDMLDDKGKIVMRGLVDGQDIYHIRDFLFGNYPVAPSRIDIIYTWLLLDNHALLSNNRLFSNGAIGATLLGLGEKATSWAEQKVDKDGKNKLQIVMENVRQMFSGSRNANRVGSIPFLEKVFELGKSNKDMQFIELIDKARDKKLAVFGLAPANLGVGDNTTYNNASTFDYALYDKIGRHLEKEFDLVRNEFILPKLGITTTPNFYIEYNRPKDPDEQKTQAFYLELFKNKVISLQEVREKLDFDQENIPPELLPQATIIETDVKNKQVNNHLHTCDEHCNHNHIVTMSQKKTPAEKAIGTNQAYKFENKIKKAISRQIEAYTEKAKNAKDGQSMLDSITKQMPKIESFYGFKTLKSDLLEFAGMGIDNFNEEQKANGYSLKQEYFDGEYPQSVLDYIDQRTEFLLKGDGDYIGLDGETISRIMTIIQNNINDGVDNITALIINSIPDMTKERAKMIAQTEVANAVEKTRNIMYVDAFPQGKKAWQTSVFDVCPLCVSNEQQGKIGINDSFVSGANDTIQHTGCRCNIQYYPA